MNQPITKFKDWREYINRSLIDSGQFKKVSSDFKGETESEVYKLLDKSSLTEIRVGYLDDVLLIYLQIFNPIIPGYNRLSEGDYFHRYDFHDSKSYGGPGLEFTEQNRIEIKDILEYGLEGTEIQYVNNETVLKSSVILVDHEFYNHFDFTGRGFWARLFGPKVDKMKGVEKREVDLSVVFGGIKNVL